MNKNSSYIRRTVELTMKVGFLVVFIFLLNSFQDQKTSAVVVSLTLNNPVQSCLVSSRVINLSWSSEISGNPTYHVMRKMQGEINYMEIGNTEELYYTDNEAGLKSDKNYSYQIKVTKDAVTYYSNEVPAIANYCQAAIISQDATCQSDGPHNKFGWASASGDVSRYEVYRDEVKLNETSDVKYDDAANIAAMSAYDYSVKTVWNDGTTKTSAATAIMTLACPPTLSLDSNCNTVSPGGPVIKLSWNNLLGAASYEIYRKAPGETNYALLTLVAAPTSTYDDNLVTSLPWTYWGGGSVNYFVKAIWESDSKSSDVSSINIPRCSPFVTTSGACDASGNPEIRFSWTKTANANLYNIYRDDTTFLAQVNNSVTSHTDYLDSNTCSGGICSHSYRVEVSVTALPNLVSNTASQGIDCVTIVPPSPAPVLGDLVEFCDASKPKISLNWSPSDNSIYYTIYRNGQPILNLSNTSYVDSGVESGISYNYYIVAYGKGGTSTAASNTKELLTPPCTPPSIPNLTLSGSCSAGSPRVGLSWSPTNNTVSYEIKRGLTNSTLTTQVVFNSSSPNFESHSWIDTNVAPSTTYYYQVIAKSITGVASSSSTITSITTGSCLPTVPSVTLSRSCVSNNARVKVSWNSDNTDTSRYEVFRQGNAAPVAIISVNEGVYDYFWEDDSVSQLTSYSYKVEAVGYSNSQRSTQGFKSVTTDNCTPPGSFTLANPPSVSCQGSYPKVSLDWTASSGSTSYDLTRNRLNADDTVAETTMLANKTSPYVDVGYGKALDFSGDDYVDLKYPPESLTGNLSIEFWAKPANVSYGRQNPLCKSYGGEFCLTMETNGNLSYYHGSAGSNTNPYMSFSTTNMFSNNTWVHVVITRDMAIRKMRSYKNGNFVNSTTWSSSYDPSNSTLKLLLGKGYVYNFRGAIDEVRIYNRVLSATEIMDHKNGIFTDETGLVGAWHLDEGGGQYAYDSSNSGEKGTLGSSYGADLYDPTWISNGINAQQKYNWSVVAKNAGGATLSTPEKTDSILIPYCQPIKPGLVAMVSCPTSTISAVILNWSYGSDVSSYEIYRDDVLIKTINSADPEFEARTWDDTNNGLGLDPEVNYHYYIKAVGPTGLSNQSAPVSITSVPCGIPSAPSGLVATFDCAGTGNAYPHNDLTWGLVPYVDYYTVYRDGIPLSPNATANSFVDSNIAVNNSYVYNVKAFGPGGESDFSSPYVAPLGDYCWPPTPAVDYVSTGCSADNKPYNTVYWSEAVSYNSQKYEIYRSDVAGTPIKTIVKDVDPEFYTRIWSDNSSALSSSTNYDYTVRTVGPTDLISPYSSAKTVTTNNCGVPPPTPDLNLDSVYCSANIPYAQLSWNSASGYSYSLYRDNLADMTQSTYPTVLSPQIDKGSGSLYFDGVNDYINMNNPTSLQIQDALTISAWINRDSSQSSSYVRIAAKGSYPEDYDLEMDSGNDDICFYVGFNNSKSGLCSSGGAIAAGNWYHVTGVRVNRYMYLYINGTLVNSRSNISIGNVDTNSGNFNVGRNAGGGNYFKGRIDEVRIYNRALTTQEILDQKNGSFASEANLRGAWHFNERAGTTAYDQSGNGNNGTLTNSPLWRVGETDSPVVLRVLPLGNLSSYKYTTKAFGADSSSEFSNEVQVTTPYCLPAEPNLAVTSQCNGPNTQASLTWAADSNTSYWSIYKKRSTEGSFNQVANTLLNSYIDYNVESGVSYDYYLVAYGSGGDSVFSSVKTVVIQMCYEAPYMPIINNDYESGNDHAVAPFCAGSASRIKIRWAPYDNTNTLSFDIYRVNVTAGETFTDSTPALYENLPLVTEEYVDGDITPNNEYIYKVKAIGAGVNNFALSEPSLQVNAFDCLNIPPFYPPMLSYESSVFSAATGGAVTLNWTDSQNEVSYKVFRRLQGDEFTWEPADKRNLLSRLLISAARAAYNNPLKIMLPVTDYVDAPVSGLISYIDQTVEEENTYEYQVIAVNSKGETLSNIIPVFVPIASPGPFTLSYARIAGNKNKLTWTESAHSQKGGPVAYDILRDSTSDFLSPETICASVTDNPADADNRQCTDNNIAFSERYYKAVARNAGGETESNVIYTKAGDPKWDEVVP